jgi:lysophospholipase L1-like esterase
VRSLRRDLARSILVAVALAGLVGCGPSVSSPSSSSSPSASLSATPSPNASALRYVALGDSYTIGTALDRADGRFPDQLAATLAGSATPLTLTANLGVNGYTSANLIDRELPALDALDPQFVTVLIGVNDVVQGVPRDRYEANVIKILDDLLGRLPANRIVTVAVPDYTVTPSGGDFGDPRQQHDGIVANNATMARLAAARGITYVDTFDISLGAATDLALVAGDGLHPSAIQYGRWVERIAPVVEGLLAN